MSKQCVIPKPKKIDPYYDRMIDLYKERVEKIKAERDEYHNQYHLCEAKLLSHKSIIKQMQAANKQLLEALEGIKADSYPGLAAKESTLLNRIYRKARQALALEKEASHE